MQYVTHPGMVTTLPHWTALRTFGDPQGLILIMLLALLSLFGVMALYTIVREFRAGRRGRGA